MNLANKLSISRILMVPIFMIFIMPFPDLDFLSGYNNFVNTVGIYIAVCIFVLASITDSIDGYIARSRNMVTDFGRFIDPVADKLLITAAVLALVQHGVLNGWFAFIIIGRELIITGFRLIVSDRGVVLAANAWGKLKMVFQTVAISFMIIEIKFVTDSAITLGDVLMSIAVVLTVISGYIYIKQNFHLLKDRM